MVTIPPKSEITQLTFVATHDLTAARATALREEAFDQQLVTPENGSGCCCVEHSTDKGQRLCLVHADKNRRQRLVRRNVRTVFWRFRRN